MSLLRHPLRLLDAQGVARWLDRGWLVAVWLAGGIALSLNVADPDLWGHIQYGRDAWQFGLPRTTTYSYTAVGYPWINHEILAEYGLALLDSLFGGPGLLVAKGLAGLAVCGAVLWHARRQGVGVPAATLVLVLMAIGLGTHWSLRPQLVSYTSFVLLLALLSYAFSGWEGRSPDVAGRLRRFLPSWVQLARASTTHDPASTGSLSYSVARLKWLWLVPPLMVLWTNSHGGFLAGLCVYLAYLALRCGEALLARGRQASGLVARLAMMGLAAALVTLVNPYGWQFHRWLYDDLKVPRPEIVEWRPTELTDPQFLPFWLMVALAVVSLAGSRRPRDLTQLGVLGLILLQALAHRRHGAFFLLACGWWLPPHVQSLLSRLGRRSAGADAVPDDPSALAQHPGSTAAAPVWRWQLVGAVGLVVLVAVEAGQLAMRWSCLKVERDQYPVSAIDYMAQKRLRGRLVCTFNWAQYALAALGSLDPQQPGILVQVDGRCRTAFPQRLLDQHFDFILGDAGPAYRWRDPASGPVDPTRVLKEGQPDLVLISRLQRPSVEVMQRQEGRWVLLYQDALAQLWGRASRYDDPQSPDYLPPAQRTISDAPQEGHAVWPALPGGRSRWPALTWWPSTPASAALASQLETP
jgi:hypothetical protein